jgi:hypothetical protein
VRIVDTGKTSKFVGVETVYFLADDPRWIVNEESVKVTRAKPRVSVH